MQSSPYLKRFIKTQNSTVKLLKSLLFVTAMVLTAQLAGDREIILPEMAALSIGCYFYSEEEWRKRPRDLFLLPSMTAAAGFGINYLHAPLAVKLSICMIVMAAVLKLMKNMMGPALATGLLPIITNCTSPAFLASILLFTLILSLSVGYRQQAEAQDQYRQSDIPCGKLLCFLYLVILWFALCQRYGLLNMAAMPPIIVTGFEMLGGTGKRHSFKKLFRISAALTLSGFIGSASLYLFPAPAIALFAAMPLVFGMLRVLDLKLSPAYAMALLPMVLPAQRPVIFSFNALAMCTYVMGTVFFLQIAFAGQQNDQMEG
ncbi:hypothetical protein [Flavobacterium sp. F52]|uniref:hypothetical protein n=1 Tax=Flavobacterium sp. F52 TaxID=1202532 RepID=UPI000272D878|nr:hypothetical protein [Flavobacterium sp. F52]EJG02192.1 hypothetical protein FF52_05915 [Flavobacterium sp. F52]